MFGLLNNERTTQLEQISQTFLNDVQQSKLNETLIQSLPELTGFNSRIKHISIEDLNGSLDERLVPLTEEDLELKIPQSVPTDIQHVLIAKGVARWVLQHYQAHLNKSNSEDYLYGSDWTHTQNDEIHYLALCLLMPKSLFKEAVETIGVNKVNQRVDLDALRNHFNLSEQAIIQQLL